MKALLIGGPQHGRTLNVGADVYDVCFPNYESLRASYSRFGSDFARASSTFADPIVRYRRENFGLALALGSRLKVGIFVCNADVSMKTAESYMIDVLASGLSRELEAREIAR